MLASANARHHQIAYVTNDMDKALELFAQDFGVSRFYPLVTGEEPVPAGGIWLKAALANVNGTEIELIQPMGESENLFSNALTEGRQVRAGASSCLYPHHRRNRKLGAAPRLNRRGDPSDRHGKRIRRLPADPLYGRAGQPRALPRAHVDVALRCRGNGAACAEISTRSACIGGKVPAAISAIRGHRGIPPIRRGLLLPDGSVGRSAVELARESCAREAAEDRQAPYQLGIPTKPNAKSGMNPNGIPG